ncbi:hypothetical protein MLD38_018883 [Melastoma candidum]|uniref:Uncharacterized protein n=1 Tax=Melastoma candidum TaxID=119954 RepID=A0ACB9R3G0_9MYRT|nr:hypothetical protein MLD38_018883 [Melastoma candidum]
MTPPTPSSFLLLTLSFLLLLSPSHSLGTASTLALSSSSLTVCGLSADQSAHSLRCYSALHRLSFSLPPSSASFSLLSGAYDSICGLRSGGYSILCWDKLSSPSLSPPKRIYYSPANVLTTISLGDSHLCGLLNGTGRLICLRGGDSFRLPPQDQNFSQVSSGSGFSCGILTNGSVVRCWGSNSLAASIQNEFGDMPMLSLEAGGHHVCGINLTGLVVCKGRNDFGQLDVPFNLPLEYSMLSLGASHSCAIRRLNKTVICWGGDGNYSLKDIGGVYFELIASGVNFSCGLVTSNFSILCWGPGWPSRSGNSTVQLLPLTGILPGPCVDVGSCDCGIYAQSQSLCSGNEIICSPCEIEPEMPPALPPRGPFPSSTPPSKSLSKKLLAFAIVGSVGTFLGLCTAIYILWTRSCLHRKKVHNSVQPTITKASSNNNSSNSNNNPLSRSSTIRRQGSRIMRRQRSGPSSKHGDRAEEFSFSELAAVTNDFSTENKIGAGSFGIVYRGKLPDGREVAIKRGETGSKLKKLQEKESAFDSELAFLSRLHHKHLVKLVGYCVDMDERLLVYEYMKNGALYDHLHRMDEVDKSGSLINLWTMRIKIALDAARGIEYLHNYAVPPIIHRDIKSSNILLDGNWNARVSDFGLSLMGPDLSLDGQQPLKAAGTVGYIDPEYYGLNVLTAKSDVYGLGVVLLELLTGKRAIFRNGGEGSAPMRLVDYAVPAIMAGELTKVLDKRVPSPDVIEGEAVELMAYTAMHCVNLEGKDRPTMSDVVMNLERALAICNGSSHGSISSEGISIIAE